MKLQFTHKDTVPTRKKEIKQILLGRTNLWADGTMVRRKQWFTWLSPGVMDGADTVFILGMGVTKKYFSLNPDDDGEEEDEKLAAERADEKRPEEEEYQGEEYQEEEFTTADRILAFVDLCLSDMGRGVALESEPELLCYYIKSIAFPPVIITAEIDGDRLLITAYSGRSPFGLWGKLHYIKKISKELEDFSY